jgi:hypothetical protein
MKRMAIVAVLLLAAAVLVWPAGAADKALTIKDIMTKLNKPNGLRPNLGQDLMADEPDWDEIQKETKEFAELAAALGKITPPVGDQASWAKLTAVYAADAAALNAAAQKKDLKSTKAAHDRLSAMNTCKSCHDVHVKK